MSWRGEAVFWLVFGSFALLAVWLTFRALIGRRNDGRPQCPHCRYDMTGAPSLTCPECGHTVKTPSHLLRRWRSPRLVAPALLIASICWYGTIAGRRVRDGSESWRTAFVPTTALIYLPDFPKLPSFEIMRQRTFSSAADVDPRLPRWQVVLVERALYQRLLKNKVQLGRRGAIPAECWDLVRLSATSDTAEALLGRALSEQGSPSLCQWIAGRLCRTGRNRTAIRADLWRALKSDALSIDSAESLLTEFGPDQFAPLTDTEFRAQAAVLARRQPDLVSAEETMLEWALLELIRRHPPDAESLLDQFRPGQSSRRSLLIEVARCRLRGQPDPLAFTVKSTSDWITFTLTNQHADGKPMRVGGLANTGRTVTARMFLRADQPPYAARPIGRKQPRDTLLMPNDTFEMSLIRSDLARWLATMHGEQRLYAVYGLSQNADQHDYWFTRTLMPTIRCDEVFKGTAP